MRIACLLTLLLLIPAPLEYDVLILNGTLHDGTGGVARRADVALRGDRIARVGRLGQGRAKQRVDARGLVVCPGLIDLHTHSDQPLLHDPTRANRNYLLQGCTLVVTGNCGSGHVDVGGYFSRLRAGGIGTNVAHLVPHGAVREQVMGLENRDPSHAELERMRGLVEKGMRDGAFGISSGLIYVPGTYAKTGELVELAKAAGRQAGFYASHIRSESDALLEAVDEAIAIGRQAGCPVHLSHLKAGGRQNWGRIRAAAARIEAARARGERVTADQYPYIASSTSLAANLVPGEAREGGEERMVARLEEPAVRAAIRERVAARGAENVMIASFPRDPAYNGRTLAELAAREGRDPAEIAVDILQRGGASGIFFGMSEADVRWAMPKPWLATASDGSAREPDTSHPHPRSFGTFPRKIGRYAIDWRILPLSRAIRSASGLPAAILGIKDRGRIRSGAFADVLVFDPQRFRDRATYQEPARFATGVRYLWVNGTLAVDRGNRTGRLAGRVVLRPSGG